MGISTLPSGAVDCQSVSETLSVPSLLDVAIRNFRSPDDLSQTPPNHDRLVGSFTFSSCKEDDSPSSVRARHQNEEMFDKEGGSSPRP